MVENIAGHALRAHLDMPFETALREVAAALKEEGFGVLTEVDVRATFRKKLDVDFRNYRILGVCNPPLSFRALSANLDAGLLLPCNVIVYEDGGMVEVAILDPLSLLSVGGGLGVGAVADEARVRLQRVADALRDLGTLRQRGLGRSAAV